MENKIYIKIPSHLFARSERVKCALSDIEKILHAHKVPFEIVEDLGKNYRLEGKRFK